MGFGHGFGEDNAPLGTASRAMSPRISRKNAPAAFVQPQREREPEREWPCERVFQVLKSEVM